MNRAKKVRTNVRTELRRRRFAPLEEKLGYSFEDKSILVEALTHAGLIGVSKSKIKSNQRLEFLGDSILQSVITDAVYRKFSDCEEGSLTKIRIALTRGNFLAELSRDLTIPKYLNVPKGSEDIREQSSAAEDAFEAIVGAIYLDSSFEKVRDVILSWYSLKLDGVPDLMTMQNPKGALQEFVAKNGGKVQYVLLSQSGPDHKKVFDVGVSINGVSYARASSSSKKNAEVEAAKIALEIYMQQTSDADEQKTSIKAKSKRTKKKSDK